MMDKGGFGSTCENEDDGKHLLFLLGSRMCSLFIPLTELVRARAWTLTYSIRERERRFVRCDFGRHPVATLQVYLEAPTLSLGLNKGQEVWIMRWSWTRYDLSSVQVQSLLQSGLTGCWTCVNSLPASPLAGPRVWLSSLGMGFLGNSNSWSA